MIPESIRVSVKCEGNVVLACPLCAAGHVDTANGTPIQTFGVRGLTWVGVPCDSCHASFTVDATE